MKTTSLFAEESVPGFDPCQGDMVRMTVIRDDPLTPDRGFAELCASLPDTTDLWPWLELAKAAEPPILYLGIGAGRLAVPLQAAGIELIASTAIQGCWNGSALACLGPSSSIHGSSASIWDGGSAW
jgi:hypothetical protein